MNCQAPLKAEATRAVVGIACKLGISSDELKRLGQSLAKQPEEVKRQRGRPRMALKQYNPDCECCQRRREFVNAKARAYWERCRKERPEFYREVKRRNAALMKRKRNAS